MKTLSGSSIYSDTDTDRNFSFNRNVNLILMPDDQNACVLLLFMFITHSTECMNWSGTLLFFVPIVSPLSKQSWSEPVCACLPSCLPLAILATRVGRIMNNVSPLMSVFHVPYWFCQWQPSPWFCVRLSMSSWVYLECGSLELYLVLIPSAGSPCSFSVNAPSV